MKETIQHDLFNLVKKLSMSEKRYFKIYANRYNSDENNLYIKLFDAIESQTNYDEKKLKKELKEIKNFSSTKVLLYKVLLKSLSSFYQESISDLDILKQISIIHVLILKNNFDQAIRAIKKVEKLIEIYDKVEYLVLIHELEFKINYIQKYKGETEESHKERRIKFDTSLKIINKKYNYYFLFEKTTIINTLFIRAIRKKELLEEYDILEKEDQLNHFGSFFNGFFYWGYKQNINIVDKQNNKDWNEYAKSRVDLFEKYPIQKIDSYKMYFDALVSLASSYNVSFEFDKTFETISKINEINTFSEKESNDMFYKSLSLELSTYLLSGKFDKGVEIINKYKKQLDSDRIKDTNLHTRQILFFNCIQLNFIAANYKQALPYINKLSNIDDQFILDFDKIAKVFLLLISYELDDDDLFQTTARGLRRMLLKSKETYKIELEIISILQKATKMDYPDRNLFMKEKYDFFCENYFSEVDDYPYFNFSLWLKSKAENISFAKLIKEKFNLIRKKSTE